ncbi:DUF2788 domain-containing protein, partial [Neisseria sp. SLRRB23]|uniref:DUF2788 domain-containing protein n=1 Tax=Neisseria sp. SLRRB23 TaxID=3435199 RepID=UPI003D7FB427
TGLIIFLGFTVWNLRKESKAGKFVIALLFLVSGLGVFGFVFKELYKRQFEECAPLFGF